jgi:hypothetical protein
MEFGVWLDNHNFHDQVKNLEFVNNTCYNMQDLGMNSPQAAGLWVDGAASQHINNLIISGNRFINEGDNMGYKYGVVLGFNIDNLYLGEDNIFYKLKLHNVWERSLTFNWRGPVIEASIDWNPGNVNAGSFVSVDVQVAGAELGDLSAASFSLDIHDLVLSAAITALNTVKVILVNNTGAMINLQKGTLFIKVTKIMIT